MRRGDICLVDLEPVRGSDSDKTRPAVIVGNDVANRTVTASGRGMVTVVPLTSNTRAVYPFQVLVSADSSGLGFDSKAQAEQVRSIAVERLGGTAGRLPTDVIERLDAALRLHLDL